MPKRKFGGSSLAARKPFERQHKTFTFIRMVKLVFRQTEAPVRHYIVSDGSLLLFDYILIFDSRSGIPVRLVVRRIYFRKDVFLNNCAAASVFETAAAIIVIIS